ncbi:unnamed protein product [Sphenostylis stenocarpa]|uniref:Uncharacterized protein n=1 Tax=Sphenostylis stenocarpa TaxID=92480 RepID=A0AA86SNP2_9FABA|nr:unnamed protein product [Sphenostylis stenocarpa]
MCEGCGGVHAFARGVHSGRCYSLVEMAKKETATELDSIGGEWLDEHRRNKASSEKVDGVHQDFMYVMISLLDGNTIDGIDADTLIKSTVL